MAIVELPTAERAPAIVLQDVCAGYPTAPAVLCGVDLTVPRGACVAVIGPSGGGKTTLLRTIAGLVPVTRGKVWCASRGPIGYIPQNLGLVRNRTVEHNVLLGALPRMGTLGSLTGRFPAHERQAAHDALAHVGLAGRGGERIETLSGGERRRVAVARALLQRPEVLLADEFLAEVDRLTAESIIRLLAGLRRQWGLTLVIVDHDVELVRRLADSVAVLVDGRLTRECAPEAVSADGLAQMFAQP